MLSKKAQYAFRALSSLVRADQAHRQSPEGEAVGTPLAISEMVK